MDVHRNKYDLNTYPTIMHIDIQFYLFLDIGITLVKTPCKPCWEYMIIKIIPYSLIFLNGIFLLY
jgi:hypothetical protein